MWDFEIPLQPKQAELYDVYENSPCTRIGAGGSRGGAKSHAARSIMLLRRLKYPRTKGMIFRRKRKDLWDNHIEKYFAQWPILRTWYTKQENEIRLPNGSVIAFRYAEHERDVDDFLGPDFMDIMLDEATQLSESTIVKFYGCNRWPALPGVRSKMLFTTNPGGLGHDYMKRVFLTQQYQGNERPGDWHFIAFRAWDNIQWALQALEEDGFTERDYYRWADERRMEYFLAHTDYGRQLNSLPHNLRIGWLLDDWNKFAGQYFLEWDQEATYLGHDDFLRLWAPQYWQPIWISIDWVSTHHAYVAWHTFLTIPVDQDMVPLAALGPENTRASRQDLIRTEAENPGRRFEAPTADIPVTFREYLVSGLGEEGLAEEIVHRTLQSERRRVDNVFLSPDCGFESELQRGYKIGSVFVRHNMPRARAAFAARVDGWRLMHEKLRERISSRGFIYAGWCITSNCPKAFEALPWAVADQDHDGDIVKDGDSPLLDVLDGLRYGVASYQYSQPVPARERKKEIIAQLPTVGPARFMAGMKFDLEERVSDQPVYFGGFRGGKPRRHGRS